MRRASGAVGSRSAREAGATSSGPAIAVRGLTARYGDVLALDGVTLEVGPGRVCALLGTNGSGKSTLLKAVLGLVPEVTGDVAVLGTSSARARRSGTLGYVSQSEQVDVTFPLDVRRVVEQGRYGHLGPTRRPRPSDHEAVAAALDRVGLTDLADRPIAALSGGQRKRAFVARALAQEARVLLLDEPFGGVDLPSQRLITAVLREVTAGGGTVLVATHDVAGLPALADEAVLLARRVLLHDAPDVVARPENLALAFGGAA